MILCYLAMICLVFIHFDIGLPQFKNFIICGVPKLAMNFSSIFYLVLLNKLMLEDYNI